MRTPIVNSAAGSTTSYVTVVVAPSLVAAETHFAGPPPEQALNSVGTRSEWDTLAWRRTVGGDSPSALAETLNSAPSWILQTSPNEQIVVPGPGDPYTWCRILPLLIVTATS